jgi:hypothetical protein
MARPVPVHHVLLAAFPFLFLFAHNVGHGIGDRLLGLALAMTLSAVVALATGWGLGRVTGSPRKGAALASLLALCVFTYGHVHNVVDGLTVAGMLLGRHLMLLPVWGAVFLVAGVLVCRARGDLARLTGGANVVAIVLLVMSAGQLAAFEWRQWRPAGTAAASPGVAATARVVDGPRPDIYYVILDGYAGARTLAELYDFDNTPFLEALRQRGFYVAADSTSNYAMTFLSLASSLNMDYLHERLDARDEARSFFLVARGLRDNAVLRFVRERGYRYIHFRSGVDGLTDYNPLADRNITCGGLSEFWMLLLQTTLFKPFEARLGRVAEDARQRVLCEFEQLVAMTGQPGPKFVFAHILVPHPPFLFDADGRPVSPPALALTGSEVWKDRAAYLAQLRFTNRRVLEAIDRLREASPAPPVIVVQGDHGPGFIPWSEPGRRLVRERMFILNAYHLPGRPAASLYPRISPVNTFRLVFNEYFDARLPLLPDQPIFSTGQAPYAFEDAREHLR